MSSSCRPPGREGFPRRFYLLPPPERAAKMSDGWARIHGGAPSSRRRGGDVSAYIPTNVISITDGQIFLETALLRVRPAINVDLPSPRPVPRDEGDEAGVRPPLELASTARAAAAAGLDAATQYLLNRGARLTEVLKQGQFVPMPIEQQVVVIYAATKGYLDKVAIADIGAFEAGLLKEVSPALLETIRTEKVISDSTDAKLKELCDGYTKGFIAAKA